jgi:hypothetical protein
MKYASITASILLTLVTMINANVVNRKLGHHSEDSLMSHSMSFDSSMSMGMSMSHPAGKGGKKSGHSSKAAKSSKASKAGKKASKKGSKSEGGAQYPEPSPSSNDSKYIFPWRKFVEILKSNQLTILFFHVLLTIDRPPTPVPPPSNLPPSVEGLQAVELARYGILYTLSESLMPMREDYLEVEAMTDEYFNAYMLDVFEEPGGNSLVQFRTTLHTSEFILDEPILIQYDSVAYFAEDFPSENLPSPQTLETLLQFSLENPSDYLELLAQLGVENAFASTTSVAFSDGNAKIPSNGTIDDDFATEATGSENFSESTGASSAAIAAGAIGAGLLIAGVIMYRRRSTTSDGTTFTKPGKVGHGGATVAGETFAGESYDGTASMAPSSRFAGDEERGTQSSDASSVVPAWRRQDRYGREDGSVSDTSAADMKRKSKNGEHECLESTSMGEDESISDDTSSVATPVQKDSMERQKLSVEQIEALLYSQF